MPWPDWTNVTRPRFWWVQTGGWSAYALDRYVSERAFFPVSFVYLSVAFTLTVVLLRPVYRAVYRRHRSPAVLLGVSILASVTAAVLWLVISRLVFVACGLARMPASPWPSYLAESVTVSLVHHKPFLFLSWSALYFGMKLWSDAQDRHRTALESAALAREAELQALRAQLNPHFLFNALNSTGALIQQDPPRAQRVLDQIAHFLRHSLTATSRRESVLDEEVAAIRTYLAVEQVRYEHQLQVHIAVSGRAGGWHVPPLLLQPLVENAVKYGMRTSPLPLRLVIEGDASDSTLTLTVRHTGHLVDPSERAGPRLGLANVRRRLELAFPGRHAFDLREEAGWVLASIALTRPGMADACAR